MMRIYLQGEVSPVLEQLRLKVTSALPRGEK